MTLAVALLAVLGLILSFAGLADPFERWESAWLRAVASIRTGWVTTLMVGINTVLASRWTVRILRLGTLVALVGLRRWQHLLTFLGSVIAVEPDYWRLVLSALAVLGDALPWFRFCKVCGRIFFRVKRQNSCSPRCSIVLQGRRRAGKGSSRGRKPKLIVS